MQAPEEQPMPVRNGAELLLDTLTAQNVENDFRLSGWRSPPIVRCRLAAKVPSYSCPA